MAVHYCPHCLTMTQEEHVACDNCGHARPTDGWLRTRRNRYAWLGEVIDERYQLVQYVGFGSTGEVYRVVSLRTGRSFAAKIIDRNALPRHVDFDELSERLSREVAVLGAIRSPHVVAAIDYLRTDDDLFVIVMDMAVGTTLERMIHEQGRIPIARALDILEQLLEALGEVHDRGVIHRDLKPENIVVRTLRSGRPFIHLLDFGVAKLRDDPGLTQGFIGTPLFSPPEQIQAAERVDERADLYSVACILFNMITGAPPYSADRGTEVMRMHIHHPIPPVPFSTGLEPMDDALRDFFNRGLAKQPEARFANVAEMLTSPIFEVMSGRAGFQGPAGVLDRVSRGDELDPAASSNGVREPVAASPARSRRRSEATSGDDSPARVALNLSGELGAMVTLSGRLQVWSVLNDEDLAEVEIDLVGRCPRQLSFGSRSNLLRLLLDDGTLYTFQARSLSDRQVVRLEDAPLWMGTSSMDPNVLVLVSQKGVRLWSPEQGAIYEEAFGKEVGANPPVVTREGRSLYVFFEDREDGLRILERADGLTLQWLPAGPLRRVGATLYDVSERARLLLNVDGRFTELNVETRHVRPLVRIQDAAWRGALWTHRRDAFFALSASGALYYAQADEAPRQLASGIVCIAATEDRSRLISADEAGRLTVWYPGENAPMAADRTEVTTLDKPSDSPAVMPLTAVGESPSLWDFWGSGLSAVVWDPASPEVLHVGTAQGWSDRNVGEGAPLLDVRWSRTGQLVGALRADGEVVLLRGRQRRVVRESMGDVAPSALALFDQGESVSVAYEEQTISTWTWAPRESQMTALWRRRMDKPVVTLRASRRAGVLLAAHSDGSTSLLDLENGSRRSTVPSSLGDIQDFCISADGHMFALLRTETGVEVYDSHAGRLTYKLPVEMEGASRVWLDPDGTLLVGRIQRRMVTVVNVADQREVLSLTLPVSSGASR